MSNNEFIEKVGAMAREDMKKTKILASLTIAQAILESNWGKSTLSQAPNNNLFGIKGEYNGKYVTLPTSEYENGKWVRVNAKFRKYPSWAESIADHSRLFNRLDRYSNLRGCTDYKLACKYVREDGYATDPSYTTKLINLIETYNLNRFDNVKDNSVNVYYRVRTKKHGWLSEVKNLNDYAGWEGSPITDIAMRVDKGTIEYQVHVKGGKWLGKIKGYNIKDYINGYAGNGKPIDAIKVYYYTPDNIRPYKRAKYKVNNYGWQYDTQTTNGQDGYAGIYGVNVTKFQIEIV